MRRGGRWWNVTETAGNLQETLREDASVVEALAVERTLAESGRGARESPRAAAGLLGRTARRPRQLGLLVG